MSDDDGTISRYTSGAAARRGGVSISRATIESTDDDKLLQEAGVSLYKGEKKQGIERIQQYGLSSRPLKPTGKKKAEALIAFMNGSRSGGVIIAVDDRRYRMKAMKEGEVALYDDQGQNVHLTRDGIKVSGGKSNKPITLECGSSKIVIANGKVTITADNIYCIGDTAVGVDSEEKPVKIKTANDTPAKRAYTKE